MSMKTHAPHASKPLGDRVRVRLLRMARTNSESFARAMMATAQALDDDSASDRAATTGLEYVDSLNGIDIYEDVTHARESHVAAASTRLRSLCHVEADIHDVVRRLTTSGSSSRVVAGIVETHELCSVLGTSPERSSEKEFPEQAGVNWFVLNGESSRDSVTRVSSPENLKARHSAGRLEEDGHPTYEFIVLSYQGIFKHRGRRGWVQWCQSVELSSFPVEASSPKRGVLFSSGIVAVESATRPNQVSVCYSMGLDSSVCKGHDRSFLESTVWKRVMKLAALKKSMLRDSLARTLSISSTDMTDPADPERSSRSSQEVSPTTKQPECEPVIKPKQRPSQSMRKGSPGLKRQSEFIPLAKIQELRTESSTTTKPSTVDKRRQRAQTMQPSSSNRPHQRSLFQASDSLEFRLSLYRDPAELPDFVPESPSVQKSSKEGMGARFVAAFKPTKGNRPKSRSLGTGWAL